MSNTETHFGKIKKLDLGGLTPEQWAHAKCVAKGDAGLMHYYNNFKEQLLDEHDCYKKYIFVRDEVWEIFDHEESDGDSDISMLTPNEDGSLSFVMQFYNGGTCLSECIEDAMLKII